VSARRAASRRLELPRGLAARGPEPGLRAGLLALALAAMCAAAAAQTAANAPAPAASAPQAEVAEPDEPPTAGQLADPWESFNRAMFAVNEVLDADLLFPLASAYVGLVPQLVRQGVSNVFNNAEDLWSAVNNLLQGKFEQTIAMTFRFAWNSTFGLAGILDMATELGIERTPEDFGQTLGVWGLKPGPYLVLPFFGPSTVRDALGLPLDIAASPAYAVNQGSFRPVTTVLQILDTRSQLLDATRVLDAMALDKYSFVRDAFLSRRLRMVYDGNPPEDYQIEPPAKPGQ
jgi:phospholipid-binding lipoprotein MlaA